MSAQAGTMSSSAIRVASRLWWPSRRTSSVTSTVRDIVKAPNDWRRLVEAPVIIRRCVSSAHARGQPLLDVRPGGLLGTAAGHDADVSTLDAELLLVGAADAPHHAF